MDMAYELPEMIFLGSKDRNILGYWQPIEYPKNLYCCHCLMVGHSDEFRGKRKAKEDTPKRIESNDNGKGKQATQIEETTNAHNTNVQNNEVPNARESQARQTSDRVRSDKERSTTS